MLRTILASLLIVSCGSGSNFQGDASSGDGQSSSDGGTNDGAAPSTKYVGSVGVVSTDAMLGMMAYKAYSASGTFFATSKPSSFCSTSTDGPCTIYDCMFGDAGIDAGAPQSFGAGMVSIDVNGGAAIPLPKMGSTYFAQGMMPLYQGGETLRATVTGEPMGAPAFTLSLTAPSRVVVSMPTFPSLGMFVMVNRSQAMNVAWSGGAHGKVIASVSATAMSRTVNVVCTYDAKAGAGTVPASALSKLPQGTGAVSVICMETTSTVQGEWSLNLNATNTAVTPSNSQAYAQAQVQ